MGKTNRIGFVYNMRESVKEIKNLNSLCGVSMLAALNAVLHFTTVFVTSTLRIGVASVTIGIAGLLYGPWLTGLVGVGADIIKYLLRPEGVYFFGFTFNEFLIGVIYGAFFYKQKITFRRVSFARTVHTILINLMLTPLWLSMLYDLPIIASFIPRLVKNAVMLPIDIAILFLAIKLIERISKDIPQLKSRMKY